MMKKIKITLQKALKRNLPNTDEMLVDDLCYEINDGSFNDNFFFNPQRTKDIGAYNEPIINELLRLHLSSTKTNNLSEYLNSLTVYFPNTPQSWLLRWVKGVEGISVFDQFGQNFVELGSIYNNNFSDIHTPDEKKIQELTLKIWKSDLKSLPLNEIDNLINDIINGRIQTYNDRRIRRIAEQLPEDANGGRLLRCYNKSRSKSNALIAAAICGGSSGGVDSSTLFYKRELVLQQWAKHSKCWIDNIDEYARQHSWRRAPELDGTESMIYTTPNGFVAKIWCMEKYHENLRLATEKIILNNFFFGDETFLNVIGFTSVNHRLRFVLLQPKIKHIKENNNYNGIAIRKYLEKKFPKQDIGKKDNAYIVFLSSCDIFDLHGGNVVKSENGNFYVIDCNILYTKENPKPWYLRGLSSTPNAKTISKNLSGIDYKHLSLAELKELYLGEWHNPIDDLQEVYKFAPERKAKTFLLDFLKKETSETEFKKLQKQNITAIVDFIVDEFDKFDIKEFFKICAPTKLKEWFIKFYFPKQFNIGNTIDYHVGDIICYKGFEETILQIVEVKNNRYIVRELGDRTRTKNEIPFSDKNKLQKVLPPILKHEAMLASSKKTLSGIDNELDGISGVDESTPKIIDKGDDFSYFNYPKDVIDKFYTYIRITGLDKNIPAFSNYFFDDDGHLCFATSRKEEIKEGIDVNRCLKAYEDSKQELISKAESMLDIFVWKYFISEAANSQKNSYNYKLFNRELVELLLGYAKKFEETSNIYSQLNEFQLQNYNKTKEILTKRLADLNKSKQPKKTPTIPTIQPEKLLTFDKDRLHYSCVHCENGYKAITDARYLLKYKSDYPKTYEGKNVMPKHFYKKFEAYISNPEKILFYDKGTYPAYDVVIKSTLAKIKHSIPIDIELLYQYLCGLIDYFEKQAGNEIKDVFKYFVPFFYNGQYAFTMDIVRLKKYLSAAKLINADTIKWVDYSYPVVLQNSKSNNGEILIIQPCAPRDTDKTITNGKCLIDYDWGIYYKAYDLAKAHKANILITEAKLCKIKSK